MSSGSQGITVRRSSTDVGWPRPCCPGGLCRVFGGGIPPAAPGGGAISYGAPLPYPRTLDMKTHERFGDYTRRVYRLLGME